MPFRISSFARASAALDPGLGKPGTSPRPGCTVLAAVAVAVIGLQAARAESGKVLKIPEAQLEPLTWAAVEGWAEDDHAAAFATLRTSCESIMRSVKFRKRARPRDSRPMRAALERVCAQAMRLDRPDAARGRSFFESHFRPVRIARLGERDGLLTGYYEPVVEGSRFPSDTYTVPLYARPSNLVVPGRKAGSGFPNKGRVGRRIGRKTIVPYYERAEIEQGVLAGRGLEICWLKDPIDAFFLQIQGSARVKLDTGKTLRVNYAAHNGHPYTPVGRVLIERGEVPKDEMSMDRIREWMENNPDKADELRHANKSYVFMRETALSEDAEPVGAQGVHLTPGRSIAVDRKLHVYGTPFFISARLPIDSPAPTTPFRRLMVAQDTGSAIVGPARADIYYGAGTEAGTIAGRFKHPGEFVMLMPRELELNAIGPRIPVPRRRPPRPAVVAASIGATGSIASGSASKSVPVPKPKPTGRPLLLR